METVVATASLITTISARVAVVTTQVAAPYSAGSTVASASPLPAAQPSLLVTASLIGGLALVAVTIWYAWQTQQMVREMRETRIASVRPSVRLDLHVVGGVANVEVANVGPGAAIGIDASLVVEADENQLESHQWTRALLGSGDTQTMLVPRGPGHLMKLSELKELGARTRITGRCFDVDGREIAIDDSLSFAKLGDRSPEGEWKGVTERLPENVEKMAKELEGIRSAIESRLDSPGA